MTDHPDHHVLERFFVDDLPPASTPAVADHLAACAACRGYVAELGHARADRLTRVPAHRFVAALEARRARHRHLDRIRLLLGAVAAAATVLVVWLVRQDHSDQASFKGAAGAPGIIVHCLRGGDVRILADAERIRAGDALRVELAMARSEPVAVWIEEGPRHISMTGDSGELRLGAGTQALPGSVVVEPPCRDLFLVVRVGASTTRRPLRCE